MKVAIIGAGITGLTVAYELSKMGIQVSLYEGSSIPGGLANSFDFGGGFIERYYHFICGADWDLTGLVKELGLEEKLHWQPTKTSYFINGKLYPFSSQLDLLRFTPISFLSRLRFGINIAYSMLKKEWKPLDSLSAVEWLQKHIGEEAYQAIWHPLLKIKFGNFYDQISAAWIWHRVHRVANSRKNLFDKERMGYLEGGSRTLMKSLEHAILRQGGEISYSTPIQKILVEGNRAVGIVCKGQKQPFDCVVSTLALPLLNNLLQGETNGLRQRLEKISFIGVVCMILRLKHPLTDSFWVNVNDPRISFNGFIEYTNINPCPQFNGDNIVYIPFYLSPEDERYHYSREQLLAEYTKALQLINKEFDSSWVLDCLVFRDKYAQAICTTNFQQQVIPHRTPVAGLYLTDSSQLYPMDRSLDGMISLAKKAAQNIREDWGEKEIAHGGH